ncbi:hypothetical protein CFOL_v3_18915, partial [Cephalotus follicularis]
VIMRGIFGKEDNRNSCSGGGSSNLRGLIERRCFAPQTLHDDGDNNDSLVVRTLSYYKLPHQMFKLSVLKLDGSLFDVNIARNATVAELKQAIEEVFTLRSNEGQGNISWSHVWGHFCLCYEGQKLTNDKACIKIFGIKDGDQLQFIRHLSMNYSPSRRQSESPSVARKCLSSGSNAHGEDQTSDDKFENQEENEDERETPMPEFKLAHFFKGWLSYSRMWGASRNGSEGRIRPSRFALQCLGGRPRMIQL